MRDPKRIPKVLKEIETVWKKHPDLRLGQLLGNVYDAGILYYVEDDVLITDLKATYAVQRLPRQKTN